MPILNAAATLEQADDFAADFGTASLVVYEGATVLATHTMAGFTTSNSGNDGLATANAVTPVTIAANGTADTVKLVSATKEWDVTADISFTTTTYVAGETSSVGSFAITFPSVAP